MIEVDGSYGEGGGQILRSAVSFSALTGEPARIVNIRAGRENPGLRPQHLKAVEAVALLCGGDADGLEVGSTEVKFAPGEIRSGGVKVDVGTAGSATLVLQALLPVALHAHDGVVLEVSGGTDVKWSPTADYLRNVLCFFLGMVGCDVKVDVVRRGFYPKGGGLVRVKVKPWVDRGAFELTERGEFQAVDVCSVATGHLREAEVAERQVKGFLKDFAPHHKVGVMERLYAESQSVGSSFTAAARYGNTVVGVCTLGERGLKAEAVGGRAAAELKAELDSGAPLDRHMADQIVPYVALAGGRVRVSEVTEHARTGVHVANLFGYGVKTGGSMVFNEP